MDEPIPPAPPLPWATSSEQLDYRQARNQLVRDIHETSTSIQRAESWLARNDAEPGFLPEWQLRSIAGGLAHQKQWLARYQATARELTREPAETDPDAPALLSSIAELIAAARRVSPKLRLFTVTLAPVAWRTLAPEFTADRGKRVLTFQRATVQLARLDFATVDEVVLDCRAGQWSAFVPPPSIPQEPPYRDCYNRLRTQGYAPDEAAALTCDMAVSNQVTGPAGPPALKLPKVAQHRQIAP